MIYRKRRDWRAAGDSRTWDDAVRCVCSTQCMLYLVYAVLSVNSWSWHGEIERDDLTLCFQLMVELTTGKRGMTGYGGDHHERLGLERILGASELPIPDTAGTSPDPAYIHTGSTSSQPNQASRTPDFSYPLISSTLFWSSSPISLFLIYNSTIIAEHNVMSSLSISLCHDLELTPSTAYTKYSIHQVQHTLSTAYTEYSIHWVQHTPSTAYTKYSIHQVQHTPSTAYTKYSIHRVQHTPSTAYTGYSIHPRLILFPSFSWLWVNP